MEGIGNAIAAALTFGYSMAVALIFGAGVFVGWLLFSALPDWWPAIKAGIHAATA
jgi:uncharacterized membrane protein YciS (DUF1049 family)